MCEDPEAEKFGLFQKLKGGHGGWSVAGHGDGTGDWGEEASTG